MKHTRRTLGALLALALLCAVPATGWAESGKISIKDWANKGSSKKTETAAVAPDETPEPQATAIPAEAMMPAIEETTPPRVVEDSPEPDVIQEPQATLIKEAPAVAVSEPAMKEVSPEPDPVVETPQEPERVKTVTEWVAQNDSPEPVATPINGVKVPSGGQMNAGQVRTGAGTIDFNLIELDKLNEELKRSVPEREQLPMTIQEAVQAALTKNRDIIVTSYEPLKADGDVLAAKGEFDPVLSSSYTISKIESKASSQISSFTGGLGGGGGGGLLGGGGSNVLGNVLQSFNRIDLFGDDDDSSSNFTLGRLLLSGAITLASSAGNTIRNFVTGGDSQELIIEQDTNTFETTVQGKIPWGTQYQVKLQVDEDTSTYSGNVAEFSGGLTVSVTQPLLRGRGPKANLARIRVAKNNREVAENQLMQQVMTTVSDVVKAYWDLVGANQQLAVREQSLANAERLLDINQRRLDIGVGAALEVVQAKASVAQRTSDVISARTQVLTAEDRIKLLLDLRDDANFSQKHIVPLDAPVATELDLDEQASIARAMENRPEMKSAHLEIDSAELERFRAANEMQMKLDLTGTVFQGGRGDDAGVVFDGIVDRNDNSYSFKVAGEIPITNRSSRGQYEKARQSKRQAQDRIVKTENEIRSSVRNAMRQAATSRILVESSGQARALQETNVTAEEKRLKLGVTTSFEVLRIQEDLANAQAQEVQAVIDFQKAMTDLQLAEGTILTAHNVDYGMPEPEKPISFVRSIVPPVPPAE